jgi:hypothetical protein
MSATPVFQRPTSKNRWINYFLAKLPSVPAIDEDWEAARPINPGRQHYVAGTCSVVITLLTVILLWWQVPILRYSPVMVAGKLVEAITHNASVGAIFTMIAGNTLALLLLMKVSKNPEAVPQYAMFEERLFRAGAEYWTMRERLRSNLLFGTMHLFNLFLPLATVMGLCASGWWFMKAYLKAFAQSGSRKVAIQQSAAVHTAHNRLALFLLPLLIIGWFAFAFAF